MSLSTTIRRLRRPVLAAAVIATGLVAAGGAVAPAQAQYYAGYGYSPYSAAYCNPYYYPYGCSVPYAYPAYGYTYPAYSYGYRAYGYAPVAVGFGFGGFHRGFGGGFHHGGFHGGRGGGFHGGRGGGGGFHHR